MEFPHPSLKFLTDYLTRSNVGALSDRGLGSNVLNGSKPYLFLIPIPL
jgi:hypothetical protein